MSVPVGRSGDVDGEGGTADGGVRLRSVVGSGRSIYFQSDHRLREWVEQARLQPRWTIHWLGTARVVVMDEQSKDVFTAAMAPEPELEELPDDADDHGADGS